MDNEGASISKLARTIYKNITLLFFLVLPVKVSKAFLEMSIGMLVAEVRSSLNGHAIDLDKFNRLMSKTYNKEILALPSYTLSWFWTDKVLSEQVYLNDGKCSLKEALSDGDLLADNANAVSSAIMNNLPLLLRFKLNLADRASRMVVRDMLVTMFRRDAAYA